MCAAVYAQRHGAGWPFLPARGGRGREGSRPAPTGPPTQRHQGREELAHELAAVRQARQELEQAEERLIQLLARVEERLAQGLANSEEQGCDDGNHEG